MRETDVDRRACRKWDHGLIGLRAKLVPGRMPGHSAGAASTHRHAKESRGYSCLVPWERIDIHTILNSERLQPAYSAGAALGACAS